MVTNVIEFNPVAIQLDSFLDTGIRYKNYEAKRVDLELKIDRTYF